MHQSVSDKKHSNFRVLILLSLITGVIGLLGWGIRPIQAAESASQAVISVNSTADVIANDGQCTLREAITAANTDSASGAAAGECAAGSGTDVINVMAGTYELSLTGGPANDNATGDLDITTSMTIRSQNDDVVIVNGGNLDRVFHVVSATADVTLARLTVRNGLTEGTGGGIKNSGILQLIDVDVFNNESALGGGGIWSSGQLTLNGVTLESNRTPDAESDVAAGTTNGQSANDGGGLFNTGTATIIGSNFVLNRTGDGGDDSGAGSAGRGGNGAAIYNSGTLDIMTSTIDNNKAGHGGTESGDGNALRGGDGGGIYNDGTLTIIESTLSENESGRGGNESGVGNAGRAGDGGGIYNTATSNVTMRNSTLSKNITNPGGSESGDGNSGRGGDGGGVYNLGTLILNNVTLYNNRTSLWGNESDLGDTGRVGEGTGVANAGGDLQVTNSIFQDDRSPGDCVLQAGTLSVGAYNLLSDNSSGHTCGMTNGTTNNIVGQPSLLQPLDDYGGPTLTHDLVAESPAFGGGNLATCESEDQRGELRPQGTGCDMGAVEYLVGTIDINTTLDVVDANDGLCSLREAITAANSDLPSGPAAGECAAGDIKDFIDVPAGTYPLSIAGANEDNNASGDLDILAEMTLRPAPGSRNVVIIDANGIDRVFDIVVTDAPVKLRDLTLRNGAVTGNGGGVRNAGELILNGMLLEANSASSSGGGAYSNNDLTVNGVTADGNSAETGGGISIASGSAFIVKSSIINNTTDDAPEDFTSGNSAAAGGGAGIYNLGILTINTTTIDGNQTGNGGIDNGSGNSGHGGDGAGIYNNGTLTLETSTLSNNVTGDGGRDIANGNAGRGGDGGGLYNLSVATVSNTTFSANNVGDGGVDSGNGDSGRGGDGGGLYNLGTLDMNNNTVYANETGVAGAETQAGVQGRAGQGGGLANSAGSFSLLNTIVASNLGEDCDLQGGVLTAQLHNLIEDTGAAACGIVDSVTGNIVGADPLLLPLANYGGTTETHALNPSSSAVDAGQDSTCEDFDQTTALRPIGAVCDIGAFEVNTVALAVQLSAQETSTVSTSVVVWMGLFLLALTVAILTNRKVEQAV